METITAQKNEMSIMGRTGDTKFLWDPRNIVEVENARRTFNDLRAKGFLAFRVNSTTGNKEGEQISEFNPEAAALIMVPALQGG